MQKTALFPLVLVTALGGCFGLDNGDLPQTSAPVTQTPEDTNGTPENTGDTPEDTGNTPDDTNGTPGDADGTPDDNAPDPTVFSSVTRPDADTVQVIFPNERYDLTNAREGNVAGEEVRTINTSATFRDGFGDALVFETDNVLIAAGEDTGGQPNFNGLSGTTSVPPTGSAQYDGHYSIINPRRGNVHGSLTIEYNLANDRVGATSDDQELRIDAQTAENGEITGTAEYGLSFTAPLTGGFFGDDAGELAAGFSSEDIGGGYIYGERQAPAN